jgi:predicted acetyltransferase
MKSETLLPPGVEVRRAAAGEQAVVANLLELYAHDFSELIDLQLQPDGRFGYPDLSRYWREEGRFPFLVRVEGHLAGCVLVSHGSRITGDPRVWDMAEFFVARRYRKRGIGAAVAHEIWRRFPGPWEVRVMESNHPARAFWGAAIRAFAPAMAEGRMMEVQENRWEVFSFTSPQAPAAE